MTNKQIKYIIRDVCGENLDTITPLNNVFMFVIEKNELLHASIHRYRYIVDTTRELIKRILVRPYSKNVTKVPAHGNYDVVNELDGSVTVYEYLTSKDGHLGADYYSFDSIVTIVPAIGVRL